MMGLIVVCGMSHSGKSHYILSKFDKKAMKLYKTSDGVVYTSDGKTSAIGDYVRESREKGIDIYRYQKVDKTVAMAYSAVCQVGFGATPCYIEATMLNCSFFENLIADGHQNRVEMLLIECSIYTIRKRIANDKWGSIKTTGSILKWSLKKAMNFYASYPQFKGSKITSDTY